MKMPKYLILALGLVLVVAFQNCGNNMKFEQEGSLVAKADQDTNGDGIPDDVTGDDSDNTDGSDDGDDDSGGGSGGVNPGDGRPPGMYPTPTPSPRNGGGGGRGDCKDKDRTDRDNGCKDCSDSDNDSADDTSHSDYLCVLEGPGRSVKLNYVSGQGAYSDQSPVDAACMSQNACLNVASQAFPVKAAEKRGFCGSSKSGRVRLSDREVEEAVSKVRMQRLMFDVD